MDPLKSATLKITEAAVRYEKWRDGVVVLGFQGPAMSPETFRDQLRRAFNVNLNSDELSAIVASFDRDGDGTVDGAEFLRQFCHLGFVEKSKRARVRREVEQAQRLRDANETARMNTEAERAAAAVVSSKFSGRDLEVALEKITSAAWRYDRTAPGAVGLQGFEGASMTPAVFKEQLKRTFNVRLTPPQLGALITHFDRDGDGTVDCAEFLHVFFKRGFEQKARMWKERRDQEAATAKRDIEQSKRKAKAAEEKAALQIDLNFSEADLQMAMDKITGAALLYDKGAPGCVGLNAFEGASMTPVVFKEQLKRVFNINLSPPELGALIAFFDSDGDGTVDCSEFLIQFFKRGFVEKAIKRRRRRRAEALKLAQDKHIAERKQSEVEAKAALQIDTNFSETDLNNAVNKLTAAAVMYDRNAAGCVGLEAFEGASMTPVVFKEQLKRVFNIKLNAPELGALISEFDQDGDGTVDCAEFLNQFFQRGFKKKAQLKKARLEEEAAKALARQQEEERKLAEAESKAALLVDKNFTEQELKGAMTKLAEAAVLYDRTAPGAVGLQGFQGASMSPVVFKEQLKRTFNIKLNPPELGALIAFFDKDGDGTIDCVEFLHQFFKQSHAEKSRLWRERRQREADKRLADKLEEEEKLHAAEAKAAAAVAPFAEADMDRALDKIIGAAVKYDRRNIGMGGLKGFEGAFMEPHVFKEQLKRTFNVKVPPAELGALMAHFDIDGDNTIDCAEFLTQFFKIGLACKGILGQPDGANKLAEYKANLKERHRDAMETRRQSNAALRRLPPKARATTEEATAPTSPDTVEAWIKRQTDAANRSRVMNLANPGSALGTTLAAPGGVARFALNVLPSAVLRLANLRELWLTNNRLVVLAHEIGQLESLTTLALAGNCLQRLPPEIGCLACLQRLFVERNQLCGVPVELERCTLLSELQLHANRIATIPNVITKLRALQRLTLSDNRIETIPTAIGRLGSLVELDLDHNHIRELPATVQKMSNLRCLGLACNNFDDLRPPGVVSKLRLEVFRWSGNNGVVDLQRRHDGYLVPAVRGSISVHRNIENALAHDVVSGEDLAWSMDPDSDLRALLKQRSLAKPKIQRSKGMR